MMQDIKPLSTVELKYYLLKYYRIERQFPIVCTEVNTFGSYMADVIAANGKEVIEIEIKASLSDFDADFNHKAAKHTALLDSTMNTKSLLTHEQLLTIPNRFFYACGIQLKTELLARLKGLPYGLIVVDPLNPSLSLNSGIKILKQANKINQIYPTLIEKRAIPRMSSMIINFMEVSLNI